MSNLRELTKEEHKRAERTAFMNRMLKKQITPYQYYIYLSNQLYVYIALEYCASELNIFGENLDRIMRAPALLNDIMEMETSNRFKDAPIMPGSNDYVNHIKSIAGDKEKLLAHMYVRHMGDLSGGQIIKKLVPGPTMFYEFEGDVDELKTIIRSSIHDGLEKEAKVCFNMVQKILEELEEYFGAMELTDSAVKQD